MPNTKSGDDYVIKQNGFPQITSFRPEVASRLHRVPSSFSAIRLRERDHASLSPVCTLQRLEFLSQCLQGTDFSCLSWSRNNKRTIIWPSWTLAQVRFQAMLTSSRYDAKSAIEYIRVTRCSRVVWSHKSAGLGSHQARRKCSGEADILYRHSGSGNTFARRCAISRITVMHIHQSLGAADSSPSHEACVQTFAKQIKPSIQHTQSRTSLQRH